MQRFRSSVNPRSSEFKERYGQMVSLVEELDEKLKESLWQGKASHVDRHVNSGCLLGLWIVVWYGCCIDLLLYS